MTSKRVEATVYGRVQGVYFRQSTQQAAKKLGLVGWTANQADGTVRVVAEGDENALTQLLDYLQQGPPAAQVERVETNWSAASGEFDTFQVRWL